MCTFIFRNKLLYLPTDYTETMLQFNSQRTNLTINLYKSLAFHCLGIWFVKSLHIQNIGSKNITKPLLVCMMATNEILSILSFT